MMTIPLYNGKILFYGLIEKNMAERYKVLYIRKQTFGVYEFWARIKFYILPFILRKVLHFVILFTKNILGQQQTLSYPFELSCIVYVIFFLISIHPFKTKEGRKTMPR